VSATEVVLLVLGVLAALAVGSFTCVVIDRLPVALDEPNQYGEVWDTRPWREVLAGRSRCSSCGAPVRAVDNLPVLSYLARRGRCRSCGERYGSYHLWVELAVPLLFLGAVATVGWGWRIAPALWLIPVGVAVAVIDLRTLIVPTRIVWPALAVAVLLGTAAAAIEGEWSWLLTALVGAASLAGPLFAIWFIHPRGMGFGDVRLSVLLGWTVGFYAGTRPVAGLVVAVLCLTIASLAGILLGVVALGARGRKAQVPFGPALVLSAFLCVAFAEALLEPFGIHAVGL
jgi:leader peptidase (prepilin peptidase)/N-methyltransferase